MLFSYIYGKKINKNKNYLKASIILLSIVYLLKANTFSILLIIVCFLEGIVSKMNEISINKEFFKLSKKFEYENYNLMYFIIESVFRSIIVLIGYLFIGDIKTMLYITIMIFLSGSLVNIKKIRRKDYKG